MRSLFYIPAYEDGKLIAMLKLTLNGVNDIRFHTCNFKNEKEPHFSETTNISLGKHEFYDKNGIKQDINKIIKERINRAFKIFFNLEKRENVEFDYTILDMLTNDQWKILLDRKQ